MCLLVGVKKKYRMGGKCLEKTKILIITAHICRCNAEEVNIKDNLE